MKAIPVEARTQNVGDNSAFCRWCADTGYVTVSLRPSTQPTPKRPKPVGYYEEMAPCPYCVAGYREEFPVPKQGNSRPTKPTWGDDGYWRGQELGDFQPLYPQGTRVNMTREENLEQAAKILAVMPGVLRDMPS